MAKKTITLTENDIRNFIVEGLNNLDSDIEVDPNEIVFEVMRSSDISRDYTVGNVVASITQDIK